MKFLVLVAVVALAQAASIPKVTQYDDSSSIMEKLDAYLEKAKVAFEDVKNHVDKNMDVQLKALNEAYDFASAVVARGREDLGEVYDKAYQIKSEVGGLVQKIKDRVNHNLDVQLWMLNDAYDAIASALNRVKGWFGKRSLTDGSVIIEKVPFTTSAFSYDAQVLKGVLAELRNKYEQLRQNAHLALGLDDKMKELRDAYDMASAVVAAHAEDIKGDAHDAYLQAKAEAQKIKDELESLMKSGLEQLKEKMDELLGGRSEEFKEIIDKLDKAVNSGVGELKKALGSIKGWMWNAIDSFMEPYTDRKKRTVSGFADLTEDQREQWSNVVGQLKQKLKEKFGVQDPDADYRVDPEVREKFKAVMKELVKATQHRKGDDGHEDLTDDDWREKYDKVIDELNRKFQDNRQRRQIDFEFDFGIERFFKKEFKKFSDFLKKIFGRTDLHDAKEYVKGKIQEAVAAAREFKDNFDVEKFKSDVKDQLKQAVDKVRSLGKKINVQNVKAIVEESVKNAVLAARKVKSEWEASKLKQDLEHLVDDSAKYLNRFVNQFTSVEDLEEQLKDLKQAVKSKVMEAVDEIRAHESDLKQIRDNVVDKVTAALNSVHSKVKSLDLVKFRETVIGKVNEIVDKVKSLDVEKFKEELRKAKEGAKKLGEKVHVGLKDVAEKIASEMGKRDLKGFHQMSAEEQAQWNSVLAELKKVLKEKYGVQDPEEDYRLSPDVRAKLSEVRKELLQTAGQTGHDDQTDDEWKEKWGRVVDELKQKLKPQEKRELKGFHQMTAEEQAQWNSVLAELKKVLKEKYGVQDPEEDYRLSPDVRAKLSEVRKQLLQTAGQTGHDDQTDDEWKEKWGRVVDELKQKLKPQERRALKGYEDMSDDERRQHDALLNELRQKLREKFGVQDENEGLRPSNESRQKLKQVLKAIRKDQGYEDLTDAEWKEKYQRVIDQLRAKFNGA